MLDITMLICGITATAILAPVAAAVLGTAPSLSDCPSLSGHEPSVQSNGYHAEDGSWAHACYKNAERPAISFVLAVGAISKTAIAAMLRVAGSVYA